MQIRQTTFVVLLVIFTALLPQYTGAQTAWQEGFTIAPYGWLIGVDGEVGSPNEGGGGLPDFVDVVLDSELEEAGFMLFAEWRAERWTVFGDAVWVRAGQPASVSVVGFLPGTNFRADVDGIITQAAAGYRLAESATASFVAFAGLRNFNVEVEISAEGGLLPEQISVDGSDNWTDIVFGARYRTRLSEKWHGSVLADLGIGDSTDSWQASVSFGYQIGTGSVLLGYRHMSVDAESASLLIDLGFTGPMIGYAFAF